MPLDHVKKLIIQLVLWCQTIHFLKKLEHDSVRQFLRLYNLSNFVVPNFVNQKAEVLCKQIYSFLICPSSEARSPVIMLQVISSVISPASGNKDAYCPPLLRWYVLSFNEVATVRNDHPWKWHFVAACSNLTSPDFDEKHKCSFYAKAV